MTDRSRPGRATLAGRLLTAYAVVFIVLIGLFGIIARNGMVNVLETRQREQLASEARLIAIDLGTLPPARLQAAAAERSDALEARVTVVDRSGTVLADSASDPASMRNLATRPEVATALAGSVGTDRRTSATTGEKRFYLAIPAVEGRIFRLSVTEAQLAVLAGAVGSRIAVAALLAGIVGVALVAVVARLIAQPIEELTDVAAEVSEGRLDVRARPSSVAELDRLGLAVSRMSTELGRRILEARSEAETLQALLDALPQGVLLVGRDEAILFGNQTAAALAGGVPDRLGTLTPLGLHRVVRQAAEAQETVETEIEFGPAGPTIRAMATPLPDDRVLLVMTDVSEQLRVEAMRRDFVADASHELKTPVSTILAASETMRMALSRDPDRVLGFLSNVEDSARHLARVVGDLLDLSRLETSEAGDDVVRLDEIAREEVVTLTPTAREGGVDLVMDLIPVVVRGARSDIGLAIRNLVHNAIRHSDDGDRVHVGMTVGAGSVQISVTDTGTGIPQRSLGRVFERFYRVDVARSRETGGTGLGLAIVKHVAESHGGSVSVESELGAGSTFHFVLPAPTVEDSRSLDGDA